MKKNRNFARLLLVLLFVAVSFSVIAQTEAKPPEDLVNVFAVVSDNIEMSFKEAANALNREEKIDSFPLQGFQIHCTLYLTKYPTGLQKEILAKVEEYAKTHCEFNINTTGLEITPSDWFFMTLERNDSLQHFSNGIVEILSPLRSKSDFIPEWAKKFPNKVKYISKFGSPNVYEEFSPHLTFLSHADHGKLVRFCEKHEDSAFARKVSGKVVAIGVGIAGKAGQITESWKIFPLHKSE